MAGGGMNSLRRNYGKAAAVSGVALAYTAFLFLAAVAAGAHTEWPVVAFSMDGTPVSFEMHDEGEPSLVLAHGWSFDARYWREQVPVVSDSRRVIVLELAGHGHSGMARTDFTMSSFGEDVFAVVEAAGVERVTLAGHSMGGSVIVEAARLMPERVMGLVGVDNLENVARRMTEEANKIISPFQKDFPEATRRFVYEMFREDADPGLKQWVVSGMVSAPPEVAVSAMTEMLSQYVCGEAARIFEDVRVPVVSVNSDLWPIDYEADKRHMFFYDAIVLEGADHFLMMTRPEEFNTALEEAIGIIVVKGLEETGRE